MLGGVTQVCLPQGLPQSFDPAVEDPWDGLRGEGGESYWGEDPLENIPGGTQGLKEQLDLRQLLQTLLVQVRAKNDTMDATYVLTMLEALQQLKVFPRSACACVMGAQVYRQLLRVGVLLCVHAQ